MFSCFKAGKLKGLRSPLFRMIPVLKADSYTWPVHLGPSVLNLRENENELKLRYDWLVSECTMQVMAYIEQEFSLDCIFSWSAKPTPSN